MESARRSPSPPSAPTPLSLVLIKNLAKLILAAATPRACVGFCGEVPGDAK